MAQLHTLKKTTSNWHLQAPERKRGAGTAHAASDEDAHGHLSTRRRSQHRGTITLSPTPRSPRAPFPTARPRSPTWTPGGVRSAPTLLTGGSGTCRCPWPWTGGPARGPALQGGRRTRGAVHPPADHPVLRGLQNRTECSLAHSAET